MSRGDEFKVGIIGCGGIAGRHASVLSGIDRVESVERHGVKSQVGLMSRFGEAVERVREGAEMLRFVLAVREAGETGRVIDLS